MKEQIDFYTIDVNDLHQALRQYRGSMAKIAKEAGVHPSYVSHILSGIRKPVEGGKAEQKFIRTVEKAREIGDMLQTLARRNVGKFPTKKPKGIKVVQDVPLFAQASM